MKNVFVGALILLMHPFAYADTTLLAVADDELRGNPFLAEYRDGQFVTLPFVFSGSSASGALNSIAQAWKHCGKPKAFNRHGRQHDVKNIEIHDPQLDGQLFKLEIPGISKKNDNPILVSCGNAAPNIVSQTKVTLAPEHSTRFRAIAEKLAADFVNRRGDRNWKLGRTSAFRVQGTPWVVIKTMVILKEGEHGQEWTDDRGYVFQVVDVDKWRIKWQAFGHPEWLSSDVGVREISADLFFRLGSSSRVLMLGIHGSGWESSGERAIYDLESGEVRSVIYVSESE